MTSIDDMNGSYKQGDTVVVPDPIADDLWDHSFVGSVRRLWNDWELEPPHGVDMATVQDQDGDCFDIECRRLDRWRSEG